MHRPTSAALLLLVFLAGGLGKAQAAQSGVALVTSEPNRSLIDAALPDDPSVHLQSAPNLGPQKNSISTTEPIAPIHTEAIPPLWIAQPLRARDKAIIGVRDLYSPSILATILLTAGLQQIGNSEPHFGTDRGAFGERLGANGILNASVYLFTDAMFAPLLHEDPRYYVEGPQHSALHRTLYAATRTILTRTDDGHIGINKSLLLGCAASSALENTYYPPSDRTFAGTANSFAGSIENAALDYFFEEFSDDVLVKLHLKRSEGRRSGDSPRRD